MIFPTGSTGAVCENVCQARNASGTVWSPVGSPVLEATTRAKRAVSSATSRRPMSPPQSWQKSVMPRRSSLAKHLAHPADVPFVGVVLPLVGLVAPPESDEIGRHDAVPVLDEAGDHLPVQEGPRRLAVQEKHGRGAAGALVDVVHAKAAHLDVPRLEGKAGQVAKALVGRAKDVHRPFSLHFATTKGDRAMRELRGKVAVVTGAPAASDARSPSGLPREGMKLVLADVEEGPLGQVTRRDREGRSRGHHRSHRRLEGRARSTRSRAARSTRSAPRTSCATTPASAAGG